jgi:hypothetical protein
VAQPCRVCTHPGRDDIDRRLTRNSDSIRDVAGRYGVSRSAVHRHATLHLLGQVANPRTQGQHPPPVMERAEAVAELARREGLVAEVRTLQDLAQRILDLAMDQGDLRTALGSLDRLQRGIELLARLSGLLEAGAARVEVTASATAAAAVAVDVSEESLGRAIAMALAAQGGGGVAEVEPLPVTAPSHWRSLVGEEDAQERPRRRRAVIAAVDDYSAAAAPLRASQRLPVC